MNIIHIIPSAFDYFKDIKEVAFQLVDAMNVAGVNAAPVALEYAPPTKVERAEIIQAAPNIRPEFKGESKLTEVIDEFAEYDLVHVHCPFLGGAGKILEWKKHNPRRPLLVTYYRDVGFTDLFSLIVRWYNAYYLPKLFTAADLVSCFSEIDFMKSNGRHWLKNMDKLAPLGGSLRRTPLTKNSYEVKLYDEGQTINGLIEVYNLLIN